MSNKLYTLYKRQGPRVQVVFERKAEEQAFAWAEENLNGCGWFTLRKTPGGYEVERGDKIERLGEDVRRCFFGDYTLTEEAPMPPTLAFAASDAASINQKLDFLELTTERFGQSGRRAFYDKYGVLVFFSTNPAETRKRCDEVLRGMQGVK